MVKYTFLYPVTNSEFLDFDRYENLIYEPRMVEKFYPENPVWLSSILIYVV